MSDQTVSAKINEIRRNAGNTLSACPTCCKSADAPYRRQDASGNYIEGCIDSIHTGKLYGMSLAWHNRPSAVHHRKVVLQWLKSL